MFPLDVPQIGYPKKPQLWSNNTGDRVAIDRLCHLMFWDHEELAKGEEFSVDEDWGGKPAAGKVISYLHLAKE